MNALVHKRRGVVGLLHRFEEPVVRDTWLQYQAMLWEWEPSVVLSLFIGDGQLPSHRFALSPSEPHQDGAVDVLDAGLLRSSSVRVAPAPRAAAPRLSWMESVEALWTLLDELEIPTPSLPALDSAPEQWARHATTTLTAAAINRVTEDPTTSAIGCAIVHAALGLRVDSVPSPAAPADPVDGWHHTLEVLTNASSAATTVLEVLAADGGGRIVPPRPTREREFHGTDIRS